MSTFVKMVLDIARDHNRGIVRDPVEQKSSQSPLDQNGNAGEKVGCCLPFIFPGVPSNKCILRDYASIKAGNLRKHWKTHSGEKSIKCNQCDYAFFQAGHLREDLKTHSGEKLHRCNQCDYVSSYAGTLNRHLKTRSR